MQEIINPNPDINKEMSFVQDSSKKSLSPLLYVVAVFVVAVVSFGFGYLIRGNSLVNQTAQELMAPETMFQEEIVESDKMMENVNSQVVTYPTMGDEDYVYSDSEFGFSLTLPSKFNVLSTNVEYTDQVSVMFYLPIESNGGSIENLFTIVRYVPGTDVDLSDSLARKITTSDDGYSYYFYQSLDVGLMPEQPEYDVYMNLVDQELFSLVKSGFKSL